MNCCKISSSFSCSSPANNLLWRLSPLSQNTHARANTHTQSTIVFLAAERFSPVKRLRRLFSFAQTRARRLQESAAASFNLAGTVRVAQFHFGASTSSSLSSSFEPQQQAELATRCDAATPRRNNCAKSLRRRRCCARSRRTGQAPRTARAADG